MSINNFCKASLLNQILLNAVSLLQFGKPKSKPKTKSFWLANNTV